MLLNLISSRKRPSDISLQPAPYTALRQHSMMKAAYITERPAVGALATQVHTDQTTIASPSHTDLTPYQILVQVKAFSINVDDINVAEGTFLGGVPGLQRKAGTAPLVIGSDFAGIIVAVGRKVERAGTFKVGQRVCGMNKQQSMFGECGTWAEYTVTQPNNIVVIPDHVSYEDAAALAMPIFVIHGLLAIKPLLKGDEKILVIGASGGIGSMLIPILRKSVKGQGNLHITGICSGPNQAFVTSLGADQVVDYTKGPVPDALRGLTGVAGSFGANEYDVVYDLVGGQSSYEAGKAALRPKGRFLSSTGPVEWIGDKLLSAREQLALVGKMVWDSIVSNWMPGSHPYYHLVAPTDFGKGVPTFNIVFDNGLLPHIEKLIAFDDRIAFEKAIQLVKSHRVKGKIVVKLDL